MLLFTLWYTTKDRSSVTSLTIIGTILFPIIQITPNPGICNSTYTIVVKF